MRQCPQCNKTYDDKSIQFCLADGTPLPVTYDSEVTLPMKKGFMIDESLIKFPIELFRVYCLFGYEIDGGRQSVLWDEPLRFHHLVRERGEVFQKSYDAWKRTKRRFSHDEVLDGQWLKVADSGQQLRLELHGDGTLTERARFDQNDDWTGKWKLIDGILRLNIQIYELDIVASREGLHSGVEDEDDHRNAYFTVAQVK